MTCISDTHTHKQSHIIFTRMQGGGTSIELLWFPTDIVMNPQNAVQHWDDLTGAFEVVLVYNIHVERPI